MLEPYLTVAGFLWVFMFGVIVLCSKAAILMWISHYFSEHPDWLGGTIVPKLSFQACVVIFALQALLF